MLLGSDESYALGGSTPEGYVDRLYQRAAPPPDDAGRVVLGRRHPQRRARERLTGSLFQSAEHRTSRVVLLYDLLLDRSPEPAGRAYWVEQLLRVDDVVLAALLAASEEYVARNCALTKRYRRGRGGGCAVDTAQATGETAVEDIDEGFVPRPVDTVVTREYDGWTVLLDCASGSVHLTDELGALVWRCLDGTASVATLALDLADAFGVGADVVRGDVIDLVRSIGAAGLLAGVARPAPRGVGADRCRGGRRARRLPPPRPRRHGDGTRRVAGPAGGVGELEPALRLLPRDHAGAGGAAG